MLSVNESETQDSGIIDVDKIYAEYEEELNKAALKRRDREALKLKEFDINLRSHRIVAGVYSIEYLEQPSQDTKLDGQIYLRTCNIDFFFCSVLQLLQLNNNNF